MVFPDRTAHVTIGVSETVTGFPSKSLKVGIVWLRFAPLATVRLTGKVEKDGAVFVKVTLKLYVVLSCPSLITTTT
jgi:hypothetical protein